MMDLQEIRSHCPYCGESLSILIDPSEIGVEYTEDCQVCCRPIVMLLDEGLSLSVRSEDDVGFE